MHVLAKKSGFYCPSWDWTFGAPVQMVKLVAFTPRFGWGDSEGRAPVSLWAVPEDHGPQQVQVRRGADKRFAMVVMEQAVADLLLYLWPFV